MSADSRVPENLAAPDPPLDPWIHRSLGMRCRTCIFFVVKEPAEYTGRHENAFGRCRRHAPTLNGYPAVFDHDWCGDHKLDENKR